MDPEINLHLMWTRTPKPYRHQCNSSSSRWLNISFSEELICAAPYDSWGNKDMPLKPTAKIKYQEFDYYAIKLVCCWCTTNGNAVAILPHPVHFKQASSRTLRFTPESVLMFFISISSLFFRTLNFWLWFQNWALSLLLSWHWI